MDGSTKYLLLCRVIFLFICVFIIFLNSYILFIFFLNPNIFLFILFLDSSIFLFSCMFIMILRFCKSCEYDLWDLVFIHLLFLFSISSPNLRVYEFNVFLHGRLYHAPTISIYVTIIMEFVTLNIGESHLIISSLNISSICSLIYSFMSKFIKCKTMTQFFFLIPSIE
jgi:hypothetical protein